MQATHPENQPSPVPAADARPVILTIEQTSERNPAFTVPSLRNLVHKAKSRKSSRGEIPGNGLAETGAIIRLGRRVLIDEAKFLAWVTRGGARNAPTVTVYRRPGDGK